MKAVWYKSILWMFFCIIFIAAVLLLVLQVEKKRNQKLDFVRQMGNGINIGNTLDATNLWQYVPNAPELDYETFWENPPITPELLCAIHSAGFQTVRIPVTFEDHMDGQGKISELWLHRVEVVIHDALDEGLYVIMDLHGDTWLDLQLNRKMQIRQTFETVWRQIALRFRDCGDHLLFEGMNEPRLRNSQYEWTSGTPELRTFVNELNQLFVDTVRQTGGNNAERYLLITPYCSNPLAEAVSALTVPRGNVIVAVHMYRPYLFSHKRDGTPQWSADNPQDVAEIDAAFRLMYKSCIKKKIPVIFTEYGCVDKGNTPERMAWAAYHMRQSRRFHIPCIWWDNGKEYRLIDRETNTWLFPGLVEVIR